MAKTGEHLYLKLSDTLAEQIMDGTLPEGTLLPSERELCQKHGCEYLLIDGDYSLSPEDVL